jgi:hypothetical protein
MSEIRPYRIDVPQADVDDLRDRLDRARWADEEALDADNVPPSGKRNSRRVAPNRCSGKLCMARVID